MIFSDLGALLLTLQPSERRSTSPGFLPHMSWPRSLCPSAAKMQLQARAGKGQVGALDMGRAMSEQPLSTKG